MSDPKINDFQPPPPPETPAPAAGPTMSTPQTLTSIFFEPGATFEALRTRPRFLIAGLITVLAFMAYYTTFVGKVGAENIARAQLERRSNVPPEQMEQSIKMQMHPVVRVVTYASFPVVFAVLFAAGAGLYLLGVTLMGKAISFKQALSVWVYSAYPQTVVYALVNIILVLIKSADDIDPSSINSGLARANPSILVDPKAQPVLTTLLGSFDLIVFYGLFLAATGLRKMTKLSSGAAWAIVLVIWLVGSVVRVALALAFGGAY